MDQSTTQWGTHIHITIASPIDAQAVAYLRQTHTVDIAWDDFDDTPDRPISLSDCLIFRSGIDIPPAVLDRFPDLSLIVRAGSGFDNIDLDAVRERGIRLVRIPGPSSQAVAELTMGLLLATARNIAIADRAVRDGHWPKKDLGGSLLAGKTLGVVGAGNIGARVGMLGRGLGMDVVGCISPEETPDPSFEVDTGIRLTALDEVLAMADVVSVHTPLDDTTRGLISTRELGLMKPRAYLLNTARGGVVDEAAVATALENGSLAGAAFDVHEQEGEGVVPALSRFDNVVFTPHIGGMAIESQHAIGVRVGELVDAYVAGKLDDEVTTPELIV